MKRLFTIALFTMLLSLLTLQAQTLTLNVSNKPLKDVLPMVEQQCDYHFFYNSSLQGLDPPVTLNVTDSPLALGASLMNSSGWKNTPATCSFEN